MNTRITASLCMLLSASTFAAPAQPPLVGQFAGLIWSAGILVPSTTTFFHTDQQLYGHYQMQTHEGLVSGQLYECQAIRTQMWRCIWSDQYGVGTLELELSTDGNRFEGEWRSSSQPHSQVGMDWTGKRVLATP